VTSWLLASRFLSLKNQIFHSAKSNLCVGRSKRFVVFPGGMTWLYGISGTEGMAQAEWRGDGYGMCFKAHITIHLNRVALNVFEVARYFAKIGIMVMHRIKVQFPYIFGSIMKIRIAVLITHVPQNIVCIKIFF
jgi:hypothetical protein